MKATAGYSPDWTRPLARRSHRAHIACQELRRLKTLNAAPDLDRARRRLHTFYQACVPAVPRAREEQLSHEPGRRQDASRLKTAKCSGEHPLTRPA
jgi:hypothetical protein